jgi:hypothetical protein
MIILLKKRQSMSSEDSQNVSIECPVSYTLSDEAGQSSADGEATARLCMDSLSILPKFGEVLFFSLRDILNISAADYRIQFSLTSHEKLVLSDLGYKYEDFA